MAPRAEAGEGCGCRGSGEQQRRFQSDGAQLRKVPVLVPQPWGAETQRRTACLVAPGRGSSGAAEQQRSSSGRTRTGRAVTMREGCKRSGSGAGRGTRYVRATQRRAGREEGVGGRLHPARSDARAPRAAAICGRRGADWLVAGQPRARRGRLVDGGVIPGAAAEKRGSRPRIGATPTTFPAQGRSSLYICAAPGVFGVLTGVARARARALAGRGWRIAVQSQRDEGARAGRANDLISPGAHLAAAGILFPHGLASCLSARLHGYQASPPRAGWLRLST